MIAGSGSHLDWPTMEHQRRLQPSCFELQATLVGFQESSQVLYGIKQLGPLLVIQRHREAPEPVHAHTTFLADLELQLATLLASDLLFQLGDLGHQLFFGWLCHRYHPPIADRAARCGCSLSRVRSGPCRSLTLTLKPPGFQVDEA